MSQALIESARANLKMMETLAADNPNDSKIANMLGQSRATLQSLERNAGATASQGLASWAQPAAPVQSAPIQPSALEQRVAALEQAVVTLAHAAAPALNEAAQAGANLMQALGAAMSPEQAAFVQERLRTSPQFLTTESSKAGIDLWLQEWAAFEHGTVKS